MAIVCIHVYKYRLISLYNVSCMYTFGAEHSVLNNIFKRYFGSVSALVCGWGAMGMVSLYICPCDDDRLTCFCFCVGELTLHHHVLRSSFQLSVPAMEEARRDLELARHITSAVKNRDTISTCMLTRFPASEHHNLSTLKQITIHASRMVLPAIGEVFPQAVSLIKTTSQGRVPRLTWSRDSPRETLFAGDS